MSSLAMSQTLYVNREGDRLETFKPWRNNSVDKRQLAEFGFYHTGVGDSVECSFCRVRISHWDRGDDPLREHIHWSPSCPFLLNASCSNVPIAMDFETKLPSSNCFEPIVYPGDDGKRMKMNRPQKKIVLTGALALRHPAYRNLDERLKSFSNWPETNHKPNPLALAEAGFFYMDKGDQVKCFHCAGALANWDEDDEPWHAHAKYFKNCDYVKRCKGEEFVRKVEELEIESIDDSSDEDVIDDDEMIVNTDLSRLT